MMTAPNFRKSVRWPACASAFILSKTFGNRSSLATALWLVADSEGWRSAFRTDVDHDSEVMPISVPNYSRKTDRLQFGILIGITSEW